MYTKESYFCKYADGKAIWFAPGATIKDGYTEKILRLMLYPETGKVLQNKITGAISAGCWVQESELDNWTEIDQPEEPN